MIDILNLAVAALSLLVAVGGIWIAIWTLGRGNRNSSAALVYSMHLGFIEAWESYLGEKDDDLRPLKMSNILGLIETSAAIHCDTAMVGASAELMEEYLRDVLGHIASRPELVAEVEAMRHTPTTFVFLDRFIDAMEARGHSGGFQRLRGVRPPAPDGYVYERRGGCLTTLLHNVRKPDFPGLLPLVLEHRRRQRGAICARPCTCGQGTSDAVAE